MKKILTTGANSYIGTSFEKYLSQWPEQYSVTTIDMIDGSWRNTSFTGYDAVYHVAGIAHSDTGRVSDERKAFYYKINTDLAIETAAKAKADGVPQFIFMSSAIVYGDSAPIGKTKHITRDTPVVPANFYGDSKVQAEIGLRKLEDATFRVCILRPPMIYGKGSKGNFPLLVKLARKLPFFPAVQNRRSMLYIGNLMEFVKLMVDNEETGTFWPQNAEYSNTSEIVANLASTMGKSCHLLPGFAPLLKVAAPLLPHINKAFGNFTYDRSLSAYANGNYQLTSLPESLNQVVAD